MEEFNHVCRIGPLLLSSIWILLAHPVSLYNFRIFRGWLRAVHAKSKVQLIEFLQFQVLGNVELVKRLVGIIHHESSIEHKPFDLLVGEVQLSLEAPQLIILCDFLRRGIIH